MNLENLEFSPIPYGTPAWYDYRRTGIGGSEVGTLLGLIDDYSSPAQLYHEKVGTVEQWKRDNQAMAWGRWLEGIVAERWQYYDGDDEGYLENVTKNRIIRKCRKVNGFVRNKNYPWLYASVDRLMNIDGGFKMLTGEPLTKEGILEVKTIEERSSSKWEGGIPPYWISQVNQYMLIFEVDYCEIAILENGRRLSVIPIERSEVMCKAIINTTRAFWEKRVEPGRQAHFKATRLHAMGSHAEAEKYDTLVQHYEPGPTPGEAYKLFLSERYKKRKGAMDGNAKIMLHALMHRSATAAWKYFERQKELAANNLAKIISDHGVEYVKFGDKGYVRYYRTAGTSVYRIDNRIRADVDEGKLTSTFDNMNVNFLRWKEKKKRNGRRN